jgi:hypothetical protein
MPILRTMDTPELYAPPDPGDAYPDEYPAARGATGLWALGGRLTWIAGLVLAISSFTGWYSGSGDGLTLSVTGWNTGTLGKLVFFVGLAVLALVGLREAGWTMPATVPESLIVIGLGSLGTVFVLVRLISIPDEFVATGSRSIGIWIALGAAVAVIAAGLLQASEEM